MNAIASGGEARACIRTFVDRQTDRHKLSFDSLV